VSPAHAASADARRRHQRGGRSPRLPPPRDTPRALVLRRSPAAPAQGRTAGPTAAAHASAAPAGEQRCGGPAGARRRPSVHPNAHSAPRTSRRARLTSAARTCPGSATWWPTSSSRRTWGRSRRPPTPRRCSPRRSGSPGPMRTCGRSPWRRRRGADRLGAGRARTYSVTASHSPTVREVLLARVAVREGLLSLCNAFLQCRRPGATAHRIAPGDAAAAK
jgi:hypothetical protein